MNKVMKAFFVIMSVLFVVPMSTGLVSAVDSGSSDPYAGEDTAVINSSATNFTLDVKKVSGEQDTWSYNVKGKLPNSCYSSVVTVVGDGVPEQEIFMFPAPVRKVIIRLIITKRDGVCAQSIKDVNESGKFKTKSNSKIDFRVVKFEDAPKSVELKDGFVYKTTIDGMNLSARYVKENKADKGKWKVILSGKTSSCYNVALNMGHKVVGSTAPMESNDDSDSSVTDSKNSKKLFDGEFYVTYSPKANTRLTKDCFVKNTPVKIIKSIERDIEADGLFRARARMMKSDSIKDGLKLSHKWLN
jgi:hypothetical protein